MDNIYVLSYLERDYYYKFYYYCSIKRRARVFLFPKGGLSELYSVGFIHPVYGTITEDFVNILHEWKFLNKDEKLWCSGERLSNKVCNETIVQCNRILTENILPGLKPEVTCPICSTRQEWKDILQSNTGKCIPTCRECKVLLVI
jgi:hypothetical protein